MIDLKEELQLAQEWTAAKQQEKRDRAAKQKLYSRDDARDRLGDRVAKMTNMLGLVACASCNELKIILNHRGPDWTQKNVDWVLDVMLNNAKNHPQLLARLAGKLGEESGTARDFLKKRVESKIREQQDEDEAFAILLG